MTTAATVLASGFQFTEGPRWHDGRLWFSDMYGLAVHAVDEQGAVERIVEVPGRPSGLGFLPDGQLLVVSMLDRALYRLDRTQLTAVADLTALTGGRANDMVVDASGRAYVGNLGYDLTAGEEFRTTTLVLVTPAGEARVVAEDLAMPNGAVITPDGATLIVAETFAQRLTAFDVASDGSLDGRRVWAELESRPDGIALDASGAVWVASPDARECLRVLEGGEVTDRVRPAEPERGVYACALGGVDGRALFLCTAGGTHEERAAGAPLADIEIARVDIAAARQGR